MIYLLEAIWYAFAIVFELIWRPALILIGISLVCGLIGWIFGLFKKKKKK